MTTEEILSAAVSGAPDGAQQAEVDKLANEARNALAAGFDVEAREVALAALRRCYGSGHAVYLRACGGESAASYAV